MDEEGSSTPLNEVFLLIHGNHGKVEDWAALDEELNELLRAENNRASALVYRAETNHGNTSRGVNIGGRRIVDEMLRVLAGRLAVEHELSSALSEEEQHSAEQSRDTNAKEVEMVEMTSPSGSPPSSPPATTPAQSSISPVKTTFAPAEQRHVAVAEQRGILTWSKWGKRNKMNSSVGGDGDGVEGDGGDSGGDAASSSSTLKNSTVNVKRRRLSADETDAWVLSRRCFIELLERQRSSIQLTVIGHSLGGLYGRSVIGWLAQIGAFNEPNALFVPCDYVSVSTPHLGSRRVAGSQPKLAYKGIYRGILHLWLNSMEGRTGRELIFEDGCRGAVYRPSIAEKQPERASQSKTEQEPPGSPPAAKSPTRSPRRNQPPAEGWETCKRCGGGIGIDCARVQPTLCELSEEGSVWLAALTMFRLTAIAITHYDFIVPYPSCAILPFNPYREVPPTVDGFCIVGCSGFSEPQLSVIKKWMINSSLEETDPAFKNAWVLHSNSAPVLADSCKSSIVRVYSNDSMLSNDDRGSFFTSLLLPINFISSVSRSQRGGRNAFAGMTSLTGAQTHAELARDQHGLGKLSPGERMFFCDNDQEVEYPPMLLQSLMSLPWRRIDIQFPKQHFPLHHELPLHKQTRGAFGQLIAGRDPGEDFTKFFAELLMTDRAHRVSGIHPAMDLEESLDADLDASD